MTATTKLPMGRIVAAPGARNALNRRGRHINAPRPRPIGLAPSTKEDR